MSLGQDHRDLDNALSHHVLVLWMLSAGDPLGDQEVGWAHRVEWYWVNVNERNNIYKLMVPCELEAKMRIGILWFQSMIPTIVTRVYVWLPIILDSLWVYWWTPKVQEYLEWSDEKWSQKRIMSSGTRIILDKKGRGEPVRSKLSAHSEIAGTKWHVTSQTS